jgi:hypothetical protein
MSSGDESFLVIEIRALVMRCKIDREVEGAITGKYHEICYLEELLHRALGQAERLSEMNRLCANHGGTRAD